MWSETLKLYLGIYGEQLRFFIQDGQLLPTPEEAALQAQALAAQEKQRTEQLAAQLRALGIEPEAQKRMKFFHHSSADPT